MQSFSPTVATRRWSTWLEAASCLVAWLTLAPAAVAADAPLRARVDTTMGSFIIQLETTRAPLTTASFVSNVQSGFYSGTIFHRVINNFVVQGGGYDEKFTLKPTTSTVPNESGNGLANKRGTVGLARTEAPHSGNTQFYINLNDNDDLDPTPLRWGYTVFGRVVDGLDVVERMGRAATGALGPWSRDAPLEPIVIRRIEIMPPAGTASSAAPAAPPATAAPPAKTAPPPSGGA
jgi:cyclophilin family peptidyl-prolyl cis-trans isomerase